MSVKFLSLLFAITLCITSCSSSRSELHVYNWTYYIPEEILKAFEKETKIRLVYDVYTTNEEMYAKLKAGGDGYDVVFPSGDYVSILASQNMLSPLEHARLPNLTNLNPVILSKIRHDPKMRFSIPFVLGSSLIAVNTRLYPDFEPSWRLFLKPELLQRTTMLDDMREVLGAALKSLGYSVNSTNEHELVAAKQVVLAWKNNIPKFDTETFAKSFAAGALFAAHCYPENIVQEYDPRRIEKDVTFFIPREGGPMYVDNMCILAKSTRSSEAHAFINYLLRPKSTPTHPAIAPAKYQQKRRTIHYKHPVYSLDSLSNSNSSMMWEAPSSATIASAGNHHRNDKKARFSPGFLCTTQ